MTHITKIHDFGHRTPEMKGFEVSDNYHNSQ